MGMGSANSTIVNSYRDLRVWQMGMDLVEDIYRVTRGFPSAELYGLTSQMRRAAVSVPSNIAEGHTREHLKEYLNFLSVAQGSVAELQTQVEIAVRLGYAVEADVRKLLQTTAALAKQLYSLRNALVRKCGPNGAGSSTQHPAPNTKKECHD